MFSRARANGFRDHISAGGLTASAAEHIEHNISNAVDMSGGGSYTLSARIVLEGEDFIHHGTSGISTTRFSCGGIVVDPTVSKVTTSLPINMIDADFRPSGSAAGITYNYDSTQIPAAGSANIGIDYNIYNVPTLTSSCHVRVWSEVDAGGVDIPRGGEEIWIRRRDSSTEPLHIYRYSNTSTPIASMSVAGWVRLSYNNGWFVTGFTYSVVTGMNY